MARQSQSAYLLTGSVNCEYSTWKWPNSALLAVVLSCLVVPATAKAVNCAAISPNLDPNQNYANIVSCLWTGNRVVQLTSGVFPLSQAIEMPPNSKLYGAPTTPLSTVLSAAPLTNQSWGNSLGAPYPNNTVLQTYDGNVVQNLRFTGDGQLVSDCCSTVVAISGSQSQLNNVEIFNLDPVSGQMPQNSTTAKTVGIYFLGTSSSASNTVSQAFIHDLVLGVIFRAGLPGGQQANTFQNSEIFRVGCDGVTLAGYGNVNNNYIHSNGAFCGQTPIPIPGAGIYAIGNPSGAQITGNTITDQCGHGLDLNSSNSFVISGNTVYENGSPMGGAYSYCGGGSPASLVDVSYFSVTNNFFNTVNVPPLGVSLNLFPTYASEFYSIYYPLPNKNQQIMAVRLLKFQGLVMNNSFDNNIMVGTCTTSACVGMGLYVGPGTGVDGNGQWSGATTNYFTRNNEMGSNIGSLRCGGDWYAANSVCTSAQSGGSCNSDDYQHVPGVNSNWSRNDVCPHP